MEAFHELAVGVVGPALHGSEPVDEPGEPELLAEPFLLADERDDGDAGHAFQEVGFHDLLADKPVVLAVEAFGAEIGEEWDHSFGDGQPVAEVHERGLFRLLAAPDVRAVPVLGLVLRDELYDDGRLRVRHRRGLRVRVPDHLRRVFYGVIAHLHNAVFLLCSCIAETEAGTHLVVGGRAVGLLHLEGVLDHGQPLVQYRDGVAVEFLVFRFRFSDGTERAGVDGVHHCADGVLDDGDFFLDAVVAPVLLVDLVPLLPGRELAVGDDALDLLGVALGILLDEILDLCDELVVVLLELLVAHFGDFGFDLFQFFSFAHFCAPRSVFLVRPFRFRTGRPAPPPLPPVGGCAVWPSAGRSCRPSCTSSRATSA